MRNLRRRLEKLEQVKVRKAAEEARKASTSLPHVKVDTEALDDRLIRLIDALDPDTHAAIILEALRLLYVVTGALESKGTRRVSPPDNPDAREPNIYEPIFEQARKALKAAPAAAVEEVAKPEEGPWPLYPPSVQPGPPPVPPGSPLPVEGEAIDELPPVPKGTIRRRTINL